MKTAIKTLAALGLMAGLAGAAFGQAPAPAAPAADPKPDYTAIHMDPVEVGKSAKDTWAKIGAFCDLGTWMKIDCKVTSGTGDVGSVRSIAGGRVTEIMTAKSEYGYGYTQPAVTGKWFNTYHGFLEVVPVSATKSKILYTLLVDEGDKADQAAKDADVARRKTQFQGAVMNMKAIAEGKPLPGPAAPAAAAKPAAPAKPN